MHTHKRSFPTLALAGILLATAGWKVVLLAFDCIPFNADEAVVALMARHILQGERPIFFYGQAYMGSLDPWLVALGFWIFGQQVWVIRAVQSLLYLGVVGSTVLLGQKMFGSWKFGLLAGLFLAFPTVNLSLYTTASLGGYGEAMLIGNLVLLSGVDLYQRLDAPPDRKMAGSFFVLGAFIGLGLWANGLTLVYSIPVAIFLLVRLLQHTRAHSVKVALLLLVWLTGALLGAIPWWFYAIGQGYPNLVRELMGSAVAVEQEAWAVQAAGHLVNFFLLGTSVILGMRPPWEVRWLVLPVLPLVLIFWMGVVLHWFKGAQRPSPQRFAFRLLGWLAAVLILGFVLTPFGTDPSGRYFLPLAIPLSLMGASLILQIIPKKSIQIALVALVIGYQVIGTLQCVFKDPPGLTTQFYEPTVIDQKKMPELIRFLKEKNALRGYSNYWVAFPLAFLSGEELIFVPQLPYHLDLRYTPRDDRYTPYQEMVKTAAQKTYITTRNPRLDERLRQEFKGLGVTWKEEKIGDFVVYYDLSQAVEPQAIGLGVLTQ